MVDVRLAPRAQSDFVDIGLYTREQWSEDQAEIYLKQVLSIIAQIGDKPLSGQKLHGVDAGYRRRRAGSHIIFYIVRPDGSVDVIRILHEKSDALRHLGL